MIAVIALIAGLGLATVVGWWLNRRSGVLVATAPDPGLPAPELPDLGLATDRPTVVHFSATWCGPCAAVRRVVDQVCAELPVAHVEIDMDANPSAARALSVLSLPTTLIFDAHGRQCYRSTGVPTQAVLRTALQALLA